MPRPCSIADALSLVGERWSLLVIRELLYGRYRFGEIVSATGAPRDILTARLRSLESAGVIERRPYQERPERHEYHLTQAGRELAPALLLLSQWGDRWASDETEPPVVFRHRRHRLRAALACQACGEQVTADSLSAHAREPEWSTALAGLRDDS